jgi:flagellar biosynthesis GTPase FlhF
MSLRELSNISISKIPKTTELYALDENIELVSPYMRVAFVERDRYGQMFIKLEFTDVGSNISMNKFYAIIHTVERIFFNKLCYMLNLSPEECKLSSQIYKNPNKKFDPILTIKIPKKKGKKYIDATIINSTRRTFYDIQQHDFVRVKIFAKCLWSNTSKFTMKWNVSELEFRDPDSDNEQETNSQTQQTQQQTQQRTQQTQQQTQQRTQQTQQQTQQRTQQTRQHQQTQQTRQHQLTQQTHQHQQLPKNIDTYKHQHENKQNGESKYTHRVYRKSNSHTGGYRGFSGGNFKDTY